MRRGWGTGFAQPGEGWLWWELTAATYTYGEAFKKVESGTSQLCIVEGQEAMVVTETRKLFSVQLDKAMSNLIP